MLIKKNIKMLVIDDDPGILEVLKIIFDMHKDELPIYEFYSNVKDFRKAITPDVHICIVDYRLPSLNGLSLIQEVHNTNPYCWFIMFSGQNNKTVIIDFMNEAYGSRYVEKGTLDFREKLIFFIKDIANKINLIESYFYESFENKQSLSKVSSSLKELKRI